MRDETWLRTVRKAGHIQRSHTEITLIPDPVSKHSHGVATILLYLYDELDMPSAQVLIAALLHDISELVTGDIPAVTKWNFPDIKDAAHEASEKFEQEFHLLVELTDFEQWILKWADMLEFYMHCEDELQAGNKHMSTPYENINKAINDKYYSETELQNMTDWQEIVLRKIPKITSPRLVSLIKTGSVFSKFGVEQDG